MNDTAMIARIMPGAEPFFYRGGATGVLVLHGLTASPHEVKWFAQHMAAQGHTVYAPRLAGHGTHPYDLEGLTWMHWYASALDGYHLLKQQCEWVVVCGLSMGGLLTLMLGAEYAVDGLVVMAAPIELRSPLALSQIRVLKYLRPFTDQSDRSAFPEYLREEQARRHEPVLGRVRYGLWPTTAVEQLLRLMQVTRQHLPQVSAPLLLMYSEMDDVVAPVSQDLIRSAVGSATVQTARFTRSGHILTQDLEHAEVFRQAAEFVAAHAT